MSDSPKTEAAARIDPRHLRVWMMWTGTTTKALAEAAGMHPSPLSKFVVGRRRFHTRSTQRLIAALHHLGAPVHEMILGGDGGAELALMSKCAEGARGA